MPAPSPGSDRRPSIPRTCPPVSSCAWRRACWPTRSSRRASRRRPNPVRRGRGAAATAWSATPRSPTRCATSSSPRVDPPAAVASASSWSAPTWAPWRRTPGRTGPSPRVPRSGGTGWPCCRTATRCRAASTCWPWPARGSGAWAARRCTSCSTPRRWPGWSATGASPGRSPCRARRASWRAGSARCSACWSCPRPAPSCSAPGCGPGWPPSPRRSATPDPSSYPSSGGSGSNGRRRRCARASSALATLSTATLTTSSRAGRGARTSQTRRPARRPEATLDLAVRVLLDGTPETEVER